MWSFRKKKYFTPLLEANCIVVRSTPDGDMDSIQNRRITIDMTKTSAISEVVEKGDAGLISRTNVFMDGTDGPFVLDAPFDEVNEVMYAAKLMDRSWQK